MKLRIQKSARLLALPALLALVLAGCTSTKKALPTNADGYVPTSIEQLHGDTDTFRDQRVVLDAYILGMEYGTNTDDADQWIMVLGMEPQYNDSIAAQLIFPKVETKLRVAEDGYNREILQRCFQICSESRRKGEEVTIYGLYQPLEAYAQYHTGVDILLDKIAIGETIINTDFNDHSVFKEKTPGMVKKTYKGVRKIANLAGTVL
ncbi:MAG: hypothetical protein QGF67_09140 [Lentisphaeria bacterium]|jgi:hypothetical protein|nr:hypothetical protein [Lentisphaeria bacterium]